MPVTGARSGVLGEKLSEGPVEGGGKRPPFRPDVGEFAKAQAPPEKRPPELECSRIPLHEVVVPLGRPGSMDLAQEFDVLGGEPPLDSKDRQGAQDECPRWDETHHCLSGTLAGAKRNPRDRPEGSSDNSDNQSTKGEFL